MKSWESISGKYNEEEWQAYLLENCEGVKEMLEMGKAQGIEEFENNLCNCIKFIKIVPNKYSANHPRNFI